LISHRTESNDSIHSLSRALVGGVQPKYGWWAPVAALYKEVGAGAHDTRFVGVANRPTDIPIQSWVSASHGKLRRHHTPTLAPPSVAMASGSGSTSHGAGYLSLSGLPLSLVSLSLSDISDRVQIKHYRVFDLA
jgi:hypothetical protein